MKVRPSTPAREWACRQVSHDIEEIPAHRVYMRPEDVRVGGCVSCGALTRTRPGFLLLSRRLLCWDARTERPR